MRCIICDENSWSNVDEFRLKPSGMMICNNCGFISYPEKWKSEEQIKEHYRNDYRQPPNAGNLFAGQRKCHFHNHFLKDLFKEWEDKNILYPKVCEIGAAFGMALFNIKEQYPGCELYGTELTTSYRRNAKQEFGLELTEDFDFTKKYDLIMSYKVAEHQLDIDILLRKYTECLTDFGYIYISVPTWFDSMVNFGLSGFDLEYYYDPNHINVWTKKHFEILLKKSGLEIIKQDHLIYGSTYLCKRNDSLIKEYNNLKTENLLKKYYEDVDDIKERLDKIKKSYLFYIDGNFKQAINLWPDFPSAHIAFIENHRSEIFKMDWNKIKSDIIDSIFKYCPFSTEMYSVAADIAMRSNKYEDAINYLKTGLELKPQNPSMYMQLINCMRELAIRSDDKNQKIYYFTQARDIARHLNRTSLQNLKESTDLIYLFNSQIE